MTTTLEKAPRKSTYFRLRLSTELALEATRLAKRETNGNVSELIRRTLAERIERSSIRKAA